MPFISQQGTHNSMHGKGKRRRTSVTLNWNFLLASLYFTPYKCISLIYESLCFAVSCCVENVYSQSFQSYSIVKADKTFGTIVIADKTFLNQKRTFLNQEERG